MITADAREAARKVELAREELREQTRRQKDQAETALMDALARAANSCVRLFESQAALADARRIAMEAVGHELPVFLDAIIKAIPKP